VTQDEADDWFSKNGCIEYKKANDLLGADLYILRAWLPDGRVLALSVEANKPNTSILTAYATRQIALEYRKRTAEKVVTIQL
jgi:hypothetical protein